LKRDERANITNNSGAYRGPNLRKKLPTQYKCHMILALHTKFAQYLLCNTVYLKNGGLLEHAQQMAAHESARTTKLYDRRSDKVTLDEVEKIVV